MERFRPRRQSVGYGDVGVFRHQRLEPRRRRERMELQQAVTPGADKDELIKVGTHRYDDANKLILVRQHHGLGLEQIRADDTFEQVFRHLVTACRIVSDVEPTLKGICDLNTVVISGASEYRFGEPGFSDDDVGGLAGLGETQSKVAQNIVRDVLKQQMRSNTAHETKAEARTCCE